VRGTEGARSVFPEDPPGLGGVGVKMKTRALVVGVLALVGAAAAIGVDVTSKSKFFAPQSGSLEEITAQEAYFHRTSKIIIGVQQSYTWTQYAQIEALKAMKSGLYKQAMTTPAHEIIAGADDDLDDIIDDDDDDDLVLLEEDKKEIPAIPRNRQMEEFLDAHGTAIAQALHLDGVGSPKLEDASNQAKIGALKYMQIQLFLGSGDVQKSYWTAKLLGTVAPPELAFYQVVKSFLSTVALSVLFQIHDSFTLEAYLDNFNDNYPTETQQDDFAEATAEYQVYSSWTALAGIKMALLYVDYAEASTVLQAFGTSAAAPQPSDVPNMSAAAGGFPPAAATGAEPVRSAASALYETTLNAGAASDAVDGQLSMLELKSGAEAEGKTQAKASFYGATDPQYAISQMVSIQYYLSLLKYYNLVAELQLAHTGSTVAGLKLFGLRILTNGDAQDDGSGYKMQKHAQLLEGIWLPQMYGQWAQITLFTYVMDAYLMYYEFLIGTTMQATAANLAQNGAFLAQMRAAEEANTVEGLNF